MLQTSWKNCKNFYFAMLNLKKLPRQIKVQEDEMGARQKILSRQFFLN